MPKERTGSIRRRGDKIFAVISYTDRFGKRKFKEKLVKNESEAHRQIRKMLNKIDTDGTDSLAPKKKTFRELCARYKADVAIPPVIRGGKTIRGLKSYEIVRYYVSLWEEKFGGLRLDKLTLALIEEAKNERLDEPVKSEINLKIPNEGGGRKKWLIEKRIVSRPRALASVNRELCTLRAMLNYAVDIKWLSKSPFADAKSKKIINTLDETQRNRILSSAEEIKLLRAVEQTTSRYLKACVYYALDCGTRRGEILKARWKDISLEDGYLIVRAENSKTERERIVYLSARVLEELEMLRADGISPDDRIIKVVDFKRSWQTALRRADIDDLRFHDLRHCHASQAVASGASLSEVQHQLGHGSLRTTTRYLHRNHESAKQYAERQNERNEKMNAEIERLKALEILQAESLN